ncbi:MAG: multicopper oxidase domain-containing protein [SAR324 cluster bacterium]|nr:multicopper oxidase domain-containing protein [SAR324 cluster bacterium]
MNGGWAARAALIVAILWVLIGSTAPYGADRSEPDIPGTAADAVSLGRDLDGDGDPDEVHIRLEVIEVQEEVYPGKLVTFWVFAPAGRGMVSPARAPSPTIRVEEGDRVRITLENTHYFPHTIHLHGTIHPNAMDGVPDITQPAVKPGEAFTYEFIARNPGTHFYHCHVQPDVHVLMGLVGMLIIEPNRPDNHFRHLIPGAGRIADLAKATMERYEKEYSLVYMEIDDRLHRIPTVYKDPREIEKRMHRDYDSARRKPNIFMLNGRSFPFTLRDTPIEVASGERVRLRVLNAGARTIRLHTHGHHPTLTHLDGYPVPEGMRYTRDVFTIGPAQRVDLELKTGKDEYYASGPGVWLMHDHTERATTNNGISPGGDITTIVYEGYLGEGGLPKVATSLDRFFDPAYYKGEVPVFNPEIFHVAREEYEYGWEEVEEEVGSFYPVRDTSGNEQPRKDLLESHRIIAASCKQPRSFRRIHIKGGSRFARQGEVFVFEPGVIHAEPCETVEIVLENTDEVRHALMIPGLNPMFTLEFRGPTTQIARFVTPDRDVTLEFHCHVPTHEEMGMHGLLIVGRGSPPETTAGHRLPSTLQPTTEPEARRLYKGLGVVISVDARAGRIVVDHEEIKDFMAPMVMSYQVIPARLLQAISAGDKVRFTIDAGQRAIVEVEPIR